MLEHNFRNSVAVRAAHRPKALATCKKLFPGSQAATSAHRADWLVDRWVRVPEGRVGVYFKVDTQAARTGTLFIETVRNTSTGQWGWVYRTRARFVLYYAAPGKVFLFRVVDLQRFISGAPATLVARNKGYNTRGVPLDMTAARLMAEQVVECP